MELAEKELKNLYTKCTRINIFLENLNNTTIDIGGYHSFIADTNDLSDIDIDQARTLSIACNFWIEEFNHLKAYIELKHEEYTIKKECNERPKNTQEPFATKSKLEIYKRATQELKLFMNAVSYHTKYLNKLFYRLNNISNKEVFVL